MNPPTPEERRALVEKPLHYPDRGNVIKGSLRGNSQGRPMTGPINANTEPLGRVVPLLLALEDLVRGNPHVSEEHEAEFLRDQRSWGTSRRVQKWGRNGNWQKSGRRSTAKRGQ
jgi:hypothetical protein